MLEGRFIFEISPGQVLLCEGPWRPASSDAEWEIAILPFKPTATDRPNFLNARLATIVGREDFSGATEWPSLHWRSSERALFAQSVTKLQTLISAGHTQKGVPWAFQTASCPNARSLWERLLGRAPALGPELVLYGAELKGESVLGASPEWLFRIEAQGLKLHTMALAGTRWAGQVRGAEQEKKDAEEHALVVEDIVQKLSRWGQVSLGPCRWWRAGSVEHLRTPIELVARAPLDAVEVLAVLHPTPAVGVFPRTPEALEWLYELPGHEERADFAAPWVVRNRQDGRAFALVALRQLRLRDDHVMIPAGCGVVGQSIEEVEWTEIQEKIHSVKSAWGLAD